MNVSVKINGTYDVMFCHPDGYKVLPSNITLISNTLFPIRFDDKAIAEDFAWMLNQARMHRLTDNK